MGNKYEQFSGGVRGYHKGLDKKTRLRVIDLSVTHEGMGNQKPDDNNRPIDAEKLLEECRMYEPMKFRGKRQDNGYKKH